MLKECKNNQAREMFAKKNYSDWHFQFKIKYTFPH